ncbi:MAG: PAS domain S-box protein, partial [Pseudonocardiaceae bacterium]|nr:PAS domain S-box protein [Pseudonocardiaceae bacterium]
MAQLTLEELRIREWSRTLREGTHLALHTVDLHGRLCALTEVLTGVLHADSFQEARANEVGAELVRLNATAPECLAGTLELIGRDLAPSVPTPEPDRCARVQGAVAAGFVAALREQVLDQQESVRRTMVQALERSEVDRQASEDRFAVMFSQAAVGVGICDIRGNILEVNQSMASLLGYRPETLLTISYLDFIYDDDSPEVHEAYHKLISCQADDHTLEKYFRRPDGSVVWAHVNVSVIRAPDGRPEFLVILASDITERYQLAQRLRHQATHDPLTGLANRSLFHEQLRRAFTDGAGG